MRGNMNLPNLPSTTSKRSSPGCWLYPVIVIATFVLVFLSAALITYLMPKKFESRLVYQVRPSASVGTSLGLTHSPQHIATEFEVMGANLTLKPVVQKLNLTSHWNMTEEDAIAVLRGMIDAQNIRGTDLVQITVKHTSGEQARDIAKEVFVSYKNRRDEKEREFRAASLTELRKAIEEQAEVLEKQTKVMEAQLKQVSSAEETKQHIDERFAGKRKILESMREELAEDKANLSSFSIIELHEEPIVPLRPSSPNVTLNLLLGAGGGLLFGILLAIFVRFVVGSRPRSVG